MVLISLKDVKLEDMTHEQFNQYLHIALAYMVGYGIFLLLRNEYMKKDSGIVWAPETKEVPKTAGFQTYYDAYWGDSKFREYCIAHPEMTMGEQFNSYYGYALPQAPHPDTTPVPEGAGSKTPSYAEKLWEILKSRPSQGDWPW